MDPSTFCPQDQYIAPEAYDASYTPASDLFAAPRIFFDRGVPGKNNGCFNSRRQPRLELYASLCVLVAFLFHTKSLTLGLQWNFGTHRTHRTHLQLHSGR